MGVQSGVLPAANHNILRLDRRRLGQRREKEGAVREVVYTEDRGHNQERQCLLEASKAIKALSWSLERSLVSSHLSFRFLCVNIWPFTLMVLGNYILFRTLIKKSIPSA